MSELATLTTRDRSMNKELFGIYGERDEFEAQTTGRRFDAVVEGDAVTVGIRDPALGMPNRSAVADDDRGCCVIWGEVFTPAERGTDAASWLLDAFGERGTDALADLNGSFLAIVERDGAAIVATDPIRSWECYYTDDPGYRVFGTDAATVSRTVANPTVDEQAVREFLHLGVTLGEKAAFEQVHRAPLDSYVTRNDVVELRRFVHEKKEFDYVQELADRLERALERRSHYPGRKGVLLSAGYDSRVLLSAIDDIEAAYTVGRSTAQETQGAADVAEQYGAEHVVFEPSERYLAAYENKVPYSQGIKESLHIHHAGYEDGIEVDTMYHGLLCDTFIRGHFLQRDTVDVFGKPFPLPRLESDPDPVESLLGKFGYDRDASTALVEQTGLWSDDPHAFVQDAVATEVEKAKSRADDIQNVMAVAGISNQPSIPFRRHLFDNYLESFFVADTELIDWHLTAPPKYRNTQTFLDALRRIDSNILDNRPPDRPTDSFIRNEMERFIRRKTPLLESFEPAWPDRREIFERYDLDQQLFPNHRHLHDLPVRHKLRMNDFRQWTDLAMEDADEQSHTWLLDPQAGRV